jgi:hypothetical protein
MENFQLVSIQNSFYYRVRSSKPKYTSLDEDKYN